MAINSMLDRIEGLVKEMRDTTDNIAHELRSPVARIRGVAESALAPESPRGDIEVAAANTVEECDRLLVMINTMLDLAAAEAKVMRLSHSPIDINGLVKNACELFLPFAEDKRIAMHVELSNDALIMGEATKIQRAIANLLENAIKYTLPSGRIVVRTEFDASAVRIIVNDNGSG